ncbi:MAG TPA: hypothetical protein VK013_14970 [Myxococcaceae bacterium]|nr:hypothetical protein [Myxococcaceae bacterium]
MRRLGFLWVALVLGLSACGDSRVAYPLEIVLDDPYSEYADIDVTYTVWDVDGYVVSEGVLADRLPIYHGEVVRLERAFYAEPGDVIEVDTTFSVDGYVRYARGLTTDVRPRDGVFELRVTYSDRLADWVVSFLPFDY